MTGSYFCKQAMAAHRELAARTAELRQRVEQLVALAKDHAAAIEAAREKAIGALVDDRGMCDEDDYAVVEAIENMTIPTDEDLRGITEALADDWDQALARWKTELDGIAEDVGAAKQARR